MARTPDLDRPDMTLRLRDPERDQLRTWMRRYAVTSRTEAIHLLIAGACNAGITPVTARAGKLIVGQKGIRKAPKPKSPPRPEPVYAEEPI